MIISNGSPKERKRASVPDLRAHIMLVVLMTCVSDGFSKASDSLAAGAETGKPVAEGAGQPDPGGTVGIANPAAVFCVRSGGIHSIRKAADGSEYGVCVFPDGTEIDAWEYFRAHAPKN